MKNRKYKTLGRPGTLVRVIGTDNVFVSLGLNPGKRTIDSFNGMNLKTRQPVNNCSGKVRPATKREIGTYWKIMKEVIVRRDAETRKKVEIIKAASDDRALDLSMNPAEFKQRVHALVARYADSSKTDAKELQEVFKDLADAIKP